MTFIKMTFFPSADLLMLCEDASIRKFGLRSLFHFTIHISTGSRQEWVKVVEEGLFCVCQNFAKSSFFFTFIQVSLLKDGCDSELR